MSLTINNNYNGVSSLFSSLNNNSSSTSVFFGGGGGGVSDMSSLLSEYNSIRNGSYAKLAKQYYAKTDASNSKSKASSIYNDKYTDSKTANKVTTKDDEKIKENKGIISDVSSLRSSISSLANDDTLLDKKTVTDDKGVSSETYDYDKILKKVKSFVNGYNDLLKSGGDSDNTTILRNTLNMTSITGRYQDQLSKIGISVNKDNTLSIDEEKFKKADMNEVTKLFSPKAGYSKQIDTAATNVASQAASNVYSLGGYTSDGAYRKQLESIYNTTA